MFSFTREELKKRKHALKPEDFIGRARSNYESVLQYEIYTLEQEIVLMQAVIDTARELVGDGVKRKAVIVDGTEVRSADALRQALKELDDA